MKVVQVRGKAYTFFGANKPIKELKKNKLLRAGTIVATKSGGLVYLEFDSNGIIVLAPNSQIMIRNTSKQGLRLVSLIKGSLYFRTMRSFTKNRPPGVITNIRSHPTAYYGENYVLTFSQQKKEISIKSGKVSVLKMRSITSKRSDKESEEGTKGENEEFDSDIDGDELTQGLNF